MLLGFRRYRKAEEMQQILGNEHLRCRKEEEDKEEIRKKD